MKILRKQIQLIAVLLMQSLFCAAQSKGEVIKYSGTIGKADIIADVKIVDTVFSGYYYFVKTGEPINLNGSVKESYLIAKGEVNDSVSGIFTGAMSAGVSEITGTWTGGAKKKLLPFEWKQVKQPESATVKVVNKNYNYVWKKNQSGVDLGCKAMYSLCFVTALADQTVQKKINNELLEADVESDASEEDISDAAIEFMDDDFDSYQEDFDSAYSKAGTEENVKWMNETPAIYQWQTLQNSDVLFNEDYLLSMRMLSFEFTGGAHGNYSYTNSVFSLKTGEQLQLDDLFKTGYQTSLNELAQLQLMSKYKVGSLQQLNEKGFLLEKGFSINDNFFIQKTGIGFTFNPYEIASYAMGPVQIIIPWSSLQQLINPNGPLAWALKK